MSNPDVDHLAAVRITREALIACNGHVHNGPVLGCPMCFLRAEYALLELARRDMALFDAVLGSTKEPIKAQLLRQEAES